MITTSNDRMRREGATSGRRRQAARAVTGALLATALGVGLLAGASAPANAVTPIDAELGSNNPGNPSNLDITDQFSGGPTFPNKLVDGSAGPLPHRDPTYANQWRLAEDVEIDGKFEGGAVWSKTKVDLAAPFAATFAIFVGSSPNLGDGMTFTLQNDPRGRDAIGSGGGSLGVYGGNWYTAYPDKSVRDPEAQARYIHNALSIEFDTFMDDAHTYPGESGDRPLCSVWLECPERLYGHVAVVESAPIAVDHNSPVFGTEENPLSNNTWRDLQVSWTPDLAANTGVLTYTFGEFGTQQYTVADVRAFFNLTETDSSVYWGFTGSAVSKNRGGPGIITGTAAEFANPMAFAILRQPGAPDETVTPVAPTVNAPVCSDATAGSAVWQTVAEPGAMEGITYSPVTVDAQHVATITATPDGGFELGELGEGWSAQSDGTAVWTKQLSSIDCPRTEAPLKQATPVAPTVNDAVCTDATAGSTVWPTVSVPAAAAGVEYGTVTVDAAHVASITATAAAGFVLGELGTGWREQSDGTAGWSMQLIPKTCAAKPLAVTGAASPVAFGGAAAVLLIAGGAVALMARRRRIAQG